MRGRHSRNLCGPVDGRGAKAPSILPSIQCFGAFTRLRWCFGPRAMVAVLARWLSLTQTRQSATVGLATSLVSGERASSSWLAALDV